MCSQAPDAAAASAISGTGSTDVVEVVPTAATTAQASLRSSPSTRMRKASSTGAWRISRPRMRQARSMDECACSEATTTRRSGSAVRAAHSAASVEVDAESSMWPCHVAGKSSNWHDPRERQLLELGHGRRRAPEHAVGVERRRQQLGEDARLRAGDREVGEEARVVPVRDARAAARGRGRRARRRTARPAPGGDAGSCARMSPGATVDITGRSRTPSR